MGFKSLSLRNFKCFDSFKLDKLEHLSALYYQNSCGKTTLIQSFVFVMGGKKTDFAEKDFMKLLPESQYGGTPNELHVTLEWETDEGTKLKFKRRFLHPLAKGLIKEYAKNEETDDDEEDEESESGSEGDEDVKKSRSKKDDAKEEDVVEEEDEDDGEEPEDDEFEADGCDYFFNERKVTRRFYMKQVYQLNCHVNGQLVSVAFINGVVPQDNRELAQWIEKNSGSSKHGQRMRHWEAMINASTAQIEKLEKYEDDLEEDREKCKEYCILKLYQLNQVIADTQNDLRKEEKQLARLKIPTKRALQQEKVDFYLNKKRGFLRQKLQLIKNATCNQIQLPMIGDNQNPLPSSFNEMTTEEIDRADQWKVDFSSVKDILKEEPTTGNVRKRYDDIKKELDQLQIDSFDKKNMVPVLVEKELACKQLIRKAQKMKEYQEEQLEKEYKLRFELFNNFFQTLSEGIDEFVKPMWYTDYITGIKLTTDNDERPWRGVECILVDGSGFDRGFTECSGGERKMACIALVIAMHHYHRTPILFVDSLDVAIHLPAMREILQFMVSIQEEMGQLVYAIANRETIDLHRDNELSMKRIKNDNH